MASGFLTKKIKSRLTLAERLKSARKKLDITLEQAEEATKVRAKYLNALETGDWCILPQEVYIRAFVLSYAKFLNLPQREVLDLFETELIINRRGERGLELIYKNSLKNNKVLITPKFLAYFSLVTFVLVLVSYIVYQVVDFAGSPNLKVLMPQNNSVVETDNINVEGVTDNGTKLTVNDEDIPVTREGDFSINLKLHRGINVVKIKAINKTKKESTQILTVEYKPATAANFELLQQN